MVRLRRRITGGSLQARVTLAAVAVVTLALVAIIAIGATLFTVASNQAAEALLADREALAQQYAGNSSNPEMFLRRIENESVRARVRLADGTEVGRPTRGSVAQRDVRLKGSGRSWSDDAEVTLAIDGDLLGEVRSRLLVDMVVTGVVALAVTALLLWFGMRYALSPLDSMTSVARSIAAGRRGTRLDPARTDTELGRTAAAFDDMLDSLEGAEARQRAAQEQVRRFVADAAHELRTPVTGVQAIAETLLQMRPDADPEEREELLLLLVQETRRAGRLVDDMVDMARIDAGLTLQPSSTDLTALADEQCRRVALLHPDLDITCSGDAPLTWADPGRVSQILANLVDNACQATPAGGRVAVAVSATPTTVSATVTDTGVGVPEADRERIFDRMVRLDVSRDRRSGGAGLGLAVARGLARSHGGELSLLDTDGPGATFRLDIPLTDAPGDTPATEATAPDGSGAPADAEDTGRSGD
ncbi:HAMP domain-containing histidine kinase [Gordonia desulfuricans]|uniref:histidine kinase n=1 Tax=Gordonia desulfuricans TaxID=89051 RepID=A0A7K3LV18_9ACTN|nr:HAMP domain-containing histidine kinase [Gordonia desulfuricans]